MKDFKKIAASIRRYVAKNSLTVSIVVFFLLLVGLVVTVDQATKQQDARSSAEETIEPLLPHVDCGVHSSKRAADNEEQKLLSMINDYRESNNVPALQSAEELYVSAAWLADDMAKKNYFSHEDSIGRMPPERVIDCGYYGKEGQIRENIHAGDSNSANAETVFNAWKKSELHNETMLDPNMEWAGVARDEKSGSKYAWYWVLDVAETPFIGTPTPRPTITKQFGNITIGPKPTKRADCIDTSIQSIDDDATILAKKKRGGKKTSPTTSPEQAKKGSKKKSPTNTPSPTNNDAEVTDTPEPTEGGEEIISPPKPTCAPDTNKTNKTPTPKSTTPTPKPTGPGIFLDITIPGIGSGGNPEPVNPLWELTVQITDTANKTVFDETVVTEFDGKFFITFIETGSQIPTGVYQIKVKYPNSLRKILTPEYQKIDSTKQTTLKVTDLVMGDIDDNNVLNIIDFNLFRACLETDSTQDQVVEENVGDETTPADETPTPEEESSAENFSVRTQAESCTNQIAADLNDDGFVDVIDYNLMLNGFTTLRGN